MYFTKLPMQKTPEEENIFYGVIDASGSMLSCWEDLVKNYNKSVPKNCITITFDDQANINPQEQLSDDLTNHGGGSTNIVAAFQLLEQELEKVSNKKVTVLFISDGEDNYDYMFEERFNRLKGNVNNLELNFIVLGLGQEFPLKTAIRFRNLYHTGNPDLTQIYHLEEPDVKNMIMTFEVLKNQLTFPMKTKTDNKHISYPFEEQQHNFYAGQWIVMENEQLSVDGIQVNVSQDKYNPKGISQCFKKWANRLKLDRQSDKIESIQHANMTLDLMNKILDDYKSQTNVDLKQKDFVFETNKNKSNFYQRIENKYMYSIHRTIQQALTTVNEIKNSSSSIQWNMVQAIHTIAKKPPVVTQNKNKAQAELEFINFYKIKKSFIELCKKLDLKDVNINSESLALLKNEDFLQAFQMIENSYQLCQSFPLKGFGVYQKKQDLQIFYPWICNIKKIALKERQFESIEIFDNFGQIKIKNYPKKHYYINSVLPLFTQQDSHKLSVVMYSDLFQLLLNNNCTKKSDVKVQEGHIAFLGKKKQSLERKQIIQQIFENLKYQEEVSVSFANVIDKLNEKGDYQKVIRQEVEDYMSKLKQFEISRILSQVLLKFKRIQDTAQSRQFLKNSLQYIIFLYIKKAQSVSPYKYFNFDFFNTQSGQKMQQEIKEEMQKSFESFKTLGDFNKQLVNLYREKLKTSNPKLIIKTKQQLEKLFSDKINILTLINIWENLLDEEFDMRILQEIIFYSAACTNLDSLNFEKLDEELLKKGFKKVQFKALAKKVFPKIKQIKTIKNPSQNLKMKQKRKKEKDEVTESVIKVYDDRMLDIPEFKEMKKEIKKEYRQYFKKIHYEVLPINSKELDKLIAQNTQLKKRFKKKPLKLNTENYLLYNACLAPKCHYYLKPINNLHHHYYTWYPEIPPHFHIYVKENYKKSLEEIFEGLKEYFKEEEEKEFKADNYGRTTEEVKQYIKDLKERYENIFKK